MNILARDGGIPYKQKEFPKWPRYDQREIQNIVEVIESQNWWRITGTKVKEFEEKFSVFQGCKYCVGVTNGTSALELALSVLGIGEGDEVIVPAMTFISTGLAVINCNATPVLADIDSETLCITPEQFEQKITSNTKAVIPVHMAGCGCDIQKICEIAKAHGIYVIEDAAHAHGGEIENKRIGSFGDMAIFSFQNGKLMTCGEGGALTTNNEEFYNKAYVIQDVGRPKGDKIYRHVIRGENYRMNEFQAAVLLAQMERVDELNKLRDINALKLDKEISKIQGIVPQGRNSKANVITHYMYMFYYDAKYFGNMTRLDFVECLNAEGIPANVCFPILSDAEFYQNQNFNGRMRQIIGNEIEEFKNAKNAADNIIWIHHRTLEGDEQDVLDIVGTIKKIKSIVSE